VHISEGILPSPVWAGSYAIALGVTGLALRRFDERRIPQVAVMTSIFFVASSIPVPIPGPSCHLLLNGLVGVVLGWSAVPAILLALLLQYLLLGEGGLSSLGANTLTMAGGAVAAYYTFRIRQLLPGRAWAGGLSGILATLAALGVSGFLYYGIMVLANPDYRLISLVYLGGFHGLLFLIEPLVTAFVVMFLVRVKPELLRWGESRT